MLHLALLRHAKSSWDNLRHADIERPLNARGEAAAPLMGRHIASLGFKPDLILCSTAKRSRQTLDHIAPHLSLEECVMRHDQEIYDASASDLLDILQHRGGGAHRILLIGHNPGLQTLALQLAGAGDADLLALMADKFPTAALAILSFDLPHWRDIKPGAGRLETFTAPKLLAQPAGKPHGLTRPL
jgi:phosphohistidine phosphatase